MATILTFTPKLRACADAASIHTGERSSAAAADDQRPSTVTARGEILLFTGVRYSRWDEADHALVQREAQLAPAE